VGLFGDRDLGAGGCVGGGEGRGAGTDRRLAGLSRNDDLHVGSWDDDLHAASCSAGGEGGGAGTEGLPVQQGFLRLGASGDLGVGVAGVCGVSGSRAAPGRTGVESLEVRGADVLDTLDDAPRCISSDAGGLVRK
jgi:hypothetical protein